MLLGEVTLSINLIDADPRSLGSEFSELGGQIAEMTALLRSARSHGPQVEEQHQRAGFDQLGQRHVVAVLVLGGEVLDDIAHVHVGESTIAGS